MLEGAYRCALGQLEGSCLVAVLLQRPLEELQHPAQTWADGKARHT